MITFLDKVKAKVSTELGSEQVLIIDNSNLHKKHKSFNSGKFYLKIVVKSEKLKNMEKIEAHKTIFSVLSDEIKSKIHALEITIR